MKLVDIFDALVGRIRLPTRLADPTSPLTSELWLIGEFLRYRNVAGTITHRLLSDAEFNQALGVPRLGADGVIPAALLPGALTSVTSVPIGGGLEFYGDPNSVPVGFLVCDGSEYLRSEYPALFAAVKTRWGRPSTDEFFRVPDKIGRTSFGAWPFANSGLVRRISIINRGQGYTPGTYACTLTGGTFTTAATASVVIINEFVPGVGTTGVVSHINMVTPGSYATLGAATDSESNCNVHVPQSALPGGTGVSYEILAQPVTGVRNPYSFSVRMTNLGTGYTSLPAVSFSGGALVGATAVAVVRDGCVVEIIVTSPGNGTVSGGPTVVITGGGGSGAAAEIVSNLTYVMQGDYVGQEAHKPLLQELAPHTHTYSIQSGGSGAGPFETGNSHTSDGTTNSTGGAIANQRWAPSIGALPLIRAV